MHYKFNVPDVSCEHCKNRIESTLLAQGSVSTAEVHIEEKTVIVDSELPSDKLIALIDEAGYDAELLE
ncbi:MAG: heavy metal-associated domain-containing protein [Spirochaetia bacterium]|nr:heavy metal-associated domain-containing protein [Spirochaetia bacterium]